MRRPKLCAACTITEQTGVQSAVAVLAGIAWQTGEPYEGLLSEARITFCTHLSASANPGEQLWGRMLAELPWSHLGNVLAVNRAGVELGSDVVKRLLCKCRSKKS